MASNKIDNKNFFFILKAPENYLFSAGNVSTAEERVFVAAVSFVEEQAVTQAQAINKAITIFFIISLLC